MDYSFEVPQKRMHFLGIRVDALIEMILFIGVILAVDAWFFEGNRFWGVKPHPFWMVILIMTVFYGTAEGILAACAATVGLLLYNLPPQQFDQDPFSYVLYVSLTPMLWLAAATVVGGFHDIRVGTIERVRGLYLEAKNREQHITSAYTKVEALARNLEKQLVGELSGQTGVYLSASRISEGTPEQAYQAVLDMFYNAMGADKLSLYLLEGEHLEKVKDLGWAEGENYQTTFDTNAPLFSAVVGQGRLLSINVPQDETIIAGEGVMAAPLMHTHTREVIGMVKIENIPFANLSETTVKLFNTLAQWVGTILVNKLMMERSLQNQISEADTGVYSSNLLARDKALLSGLAQRMHFQLAAIEVSIKNSAKVDDAMRQVIAQDLYQAVKSVLRRTDSLFLADDQNAKFSLLLPGTDPEGTKIVVDKIKAKLSTPVSNIKMDTAMLVTEKDFVHFQKQTKKK